MNNVGRMLATAVGMSIVMIMTTLSYSQSNSVTTGQSECDKRCNDIAQRNALCIKQTNWFKGAPVSSYDKCMSALGADYTAHTLKTEAAKGGKDVLVNEDAKPDEATVRLPKSNVIAQGATQAELTGPTIGPPGGTSYEILATATVFLQTPHCGFNDIGVPNQGKFLRETRVYRTYVGGKLVSSDTKNIDTFTSCYE